MSSFYFGGKIQINKNIYLKKKNTEIEAFEIKYNPNVKVKFTKSFTSNYHPKTTQVIHKENFWNYLL